MGVRSSSVLASLLHFNLAMICDRVHLVQLTGTSEMFEQILEIGEGDVMIAISFPRYSSRVENAVRYAKSNGASVIALTDSPLSPIAEGADCLLEAQSDMVSFVDSLTAPLAVINALLAAVASKKPEEVRKRLDRLEEIWNKYDVYTKR
jgi:DNA-binding MurR/RpiR family transcriptional regulator